MVLFATAAGCDDLTIAPTNEFTEENYWTSVSKAEMVLNNAYGQMTHAQRYFRDNALSDDAYVGRGDPAAVGTISQGSHNSSTGRIRNQWNEHYSGIKTVHVFLENLDRVPDMDEALKARMIAEARFIRARHYFHLTNWFGGVPLFTKDITLEEAQTISRSSHEEVIQFVQSELEAIVSDLPANYEYSESDRGRVTRGAAIALNARVSLYDNDWEGVVKYTEQLIGNPENGDYALFPSYSGIFQPENEYNSEVIFDFQYVPNNRTHNLMFDLAPLTAGARVNDMGPTQNLVNAYPMINGLPIDDPASGYDVNNPFENRDPRLSATIVHHLSEWEDQDGTIRTIYIEPGSAPNDNAARDEFQGPGSNATQTGYYLRKYYDHTVPASFNSGLNLIVIRYADVLLMHAEAKNELNQMDEQVWNLTVGALRERAGLDEPALIFNSSWSQDDLREIIRNERRIELAMEGGLRIHDLRRWRIAEDVLNGPVHGAPYGQPTDEVGMILNVRSFNPSRDYLWPIPLAELDQNVNLVQNPGY